MTQFNSPPSKTEIANLEEYAGLPLDRIFVVADEAQAALAVNEIMSAGTVGFDTESKPTFFKGQKSSGPHVLQFATADKAFIFQSHIVESQPAIISLLEADLLTKVGFGLKGDLRQIASRFGIHPNGIVDLDRSFRHLGYKDVIGVRSAIAILFNRNLRKSKFISTTDWSATRLNDRQLIYAANDAFAALAVFQALQDRPA